jgi:hypothetical protein
MSDDLARALERRSLRAHQVVIAAGAALLAVAARHADPDRAAIAAAGAAAVAGFAIALVLACCEVRRRSADATALASRRRVRRVARTLEFVATSAERGARQPRRMRPPRSVLELAPESDAIRELSALLRAHPHPSAGTVAACDRFASRCWNGGLWDIDHETLRRELGRVRFALVAGAAEDDYRETREPVSAAP